MATYYAIDDQLTVVGTFDDDYNFTAAHDMRIKQVRVKSTICPEKQITYSLDRVYYLSKGDTFTVKFDEKQQLLVIAEELTFMHVEKQKVSVAHMLTLMEHLLLTVGRMQGQR